MSNLLSRVLGSGLTHVLFAFFVMGGWAIFANQSHPMPEPLIAGLVQGTLSACITLVMKKCLDYLSSRISGSGALWAPPLVVCSCSIMVLVGIHSAAGTPELIRTIALPFSVAAAYAVFYNLALYRRKGNYG